MVVVLEFLLKRNAITTRTMHNSLFRYVTIIKFIAQHITPAFSSSTAVIYVFARNCAILVLLKKISLYLRKDKNLFTTEKGLCTLPL